MTEIDKALDALRDNVDDQKAQSGFYDLFLNSMFFLPTVMEKVSGDGKEEEKEMEVPMIIDAEGTDYLVFFDSEERLTEWAENEAPSVQLPGHVLAEMTTPELCWAMNVGTEYAKEFLPDEIAWLKDVVERCKAEADEE